MNKKWKAPEVPKTLEGVFKAEGVITPNEKQPISALSVVVKFNDHLSLVMHTCKDRSVDFLLYDTRLPTNDKLLAQKNEPYEEVVKGFNFLVFK